VLEKQVGVVVQIHLLGISNLKIMLRVIKLGVIRTEVMLSKIKIMIHGGRRPKNPSGKRQTLGELKIKILTTKDSELLKQFKIKVRA